MPKGLAIPYEMPVCQKASFTPEELLKGLEKKSEDGLYSDGVCKAFVLGAITQAVLAPILKI